LSQTTDTKQTVFHTEHIDLGIIFKEIAY